jgi:outer membrane protein assembly factor BamB
MRYLLTLLLVLTISVGLQGQQNDSEWYIFRGSSGLSGLSSFALPAKPKLLWSLTTGVSTLSSPVISGGIIYFCNDKGTLYAVTSDGKTKWIFESGTPVNAAPLVYLNKVIFGGGDGILRAVDKTNGNLLWSYKTDNQIMGSANVWISGTKTVIVVGSYDFMLHCVNPETGKSVWKIETNNYINGTPAILNRSIVIGGCDGYLRIIDPLTGKQNDTIDIGVYLASSPALSGEMAYFGDYDGNIYGVNISTCKKVWQKSAGVEAMSIQAIPAIGNNLVVVGSDDKYLYCYGAADGKPVWKFRSNGSITGSAVIANDKVLFSGKDNFIYLLGLNDGKKLWSFNAGSPVSSSPAVTKGRFYVLTEDGRLLAFGS